MPDKGFPPSVVNPDVPAYLAALNPEQMRAVTHEGAPLLILAGAGSGKTRVITTKIAWLIRERGFDPASILAVTFTNKAAREMAERAARIEPRAEGAVLRTFHSFGAWFLRRNGGLIGLDSRFVIYDDDDSTTLLGAIMENETRSAAARTAHLIARAKDYFLNPGDPLLSEIDHKDEFRTVYEAYERRLRKTGNVDFGDLIKMPTELLRAHPEVRDRFRQRFRVVLVDEYQDSNVAQFELLKELCGPETYLCVVGDDDQSIYRFRGAEVRNILEFPTHFPGTDIIRLERNYRSTSPILAVASGVVNFNEGRLGKTLISERGGGKKPAIAFLDDQDAEASFCAELVERSLTRGAKYAEWAILYRVNAQSLGFETEFLRRRIPYRVVGSLKFYEREEVKDALALLAFTVNPRDEVAFRRVVNKPTRGVGAATIEKIVEAAGYLGVTGLAGIHGMDLLSVTVQGADLAAAARSLAPKLSAKARAGLGEFLKTVEGVKALLEDGPIPGRTRSRDRDDIVAGEGLSVAVARLIIDSGIADYHKVQDEVAGTQRLANLQELVNAAAMYPAGADGLVEFLEHIELDRALTLADVSEDAVTLITLHNTKGLEFRRVVMTGLEQGVFPRDDKRDEELEEERRLFYVGATRAMDELYLCSCAVRRLYGRTIDLEPSRFLIEIPEEAVRHVGSVPAAFKRARTRESSGAGSGESSEVYRYAGLGEGKGVSADGLWRVGGKVFHDEYGYGGIVAVKEGEEGPVVTANFASGQSYRFLPRYQSASFMRLGDDD